MIDRRQNRWHDAVRNLERAMELDPRNTRILISAAGTYRQMRDYARARTIIDRLIGLEPKNISRRFWRARIEVWERGDLRPVQALVEKLSTDDSESLFGRFIPRYPVRLITNGSDYRQCFNQEVLSGLPAPTAERFGRSDERRRRRRARRLQHREDGTGQVVRAQPDDRRRAPSFAPGPDRRRTWAKARSPREGRRAVELSP